MCVLCKVHLSKCSFPLVSCSEALQGHPEGSGECCSVGAESAAKPVCISSLHLNTVAVAADSLCTHMSTLDENVLPFSHLISQFQALTCSAVCPVLHRHPIEGRGDEK